MIIPLAAIEDITDASGAAPAIEALLPAAVRERQLSARTLPAGMMAALADGRPAHLTRVLEALTGLPGHHQKRPGVIAQRKNGPHQLTCRQVEHTSRLIRRALDKDQPDGATSQDLQQICDQLLEASIPAQLKDASSSLAADWTDVEARARPVPHEAAGASAGPEARWGHRNVGRAIEEGEMFFGYYMPAAVMVNDENGPAVPELVRRITLCNSAHDPAAATVPILEAMTADGITLGDVLAHPGYSHRVPDTRASPLRGLGASLVQDLHPSDRGPPGAPTRAPSSATDASAAPPPPPRCCNWPPPRPRQPSTTSRPPSYRVTSSACTPPKTPTATAGTPAPPPPARSAARCAPHR